MSRAAVVAGLLAVAGFAAVGEAAPAADHALQLRERAPARLSEAPDGPRVRMPPMVIPRDRPIADRRPVYVGAAVVMLAAALWWNRRQRDRFDREDAGEPRPRTRRRPRRPRDDDADDLHAAARGDAPDAPDRPSAPDDAPDRRPSRPAP